MLAMQWFLEGSIFKAQSPRRYIKIYVVVALLRSRLKFFFFIVEVEIKNNNGFSSLSGRF